MPLDTSTQDHTRALLQEKHGVKLAADIDRGVTAAARVWPGSSKTASGAFAAFCLEQYMPPGKARDQLLERLDEYLHVVSGSVGATSKVIRAGVDIADRPMLPAESVLSRFSAGNHLAEDYRDAHVSALVQLNFGTDDTRPLRTRKAWAARRLSRFGRTVIPARLGQKSVAVNAEVDQFISGYNLNLDRFRFGDPKVRFPKGTKLVSHWGLRDYMTSLNGQRDALPKQRAILDVMRRVVDGQVPREVLDDPSVEWDIPAKKIRNGSGDWRPARGQGALRWEKFRDVWKVTRAIDPHRVRPNLIDTMFEEVREIPEKTVVGILEAILGSPHATRIGRYMRDQLGRDLEPFDIYYKAFHSSGPGKSALPYDIRERYPDRDALQAAIPEILRKLGWSKTRAEWIASRIRVDNGRSAGHAWPPYADHDLQLLRVRVDERGCDEISFETFMHELGHCVEGVLSSYEMDYKQLWSVPNTAFSEGFAFTFEDQTDRVLGRRRQPRSDAETLVRFWEPFEIAGPSLMEIRLFHWLYENENASAKAIQKKARQIGDEIWHRYYAPIFGDDGYGLMSVYSHIIWGDFYLAEYPMGYVIAYQVRKFLEEKNLAEETERMCGIGSIYPESWMKEAVGSKISVKPLLADTAKALDRLGY